MSQPFDTKDPGAQVSKTRRKIEENFDIEFSDEFIKTLSSNISLDINQNIKQSEVYKNNLNQEKELNQEGFYNDFSKELDKNLAELLEQHHNTLESVKLDQDFNNNQKYFLQKIANKRRLDNVQIKHFKEIQTVFSGVTNAISDNNFGDLFAKVAKLNSQADEFNKIEAEYGKKHWESVSSDNDYKQAKFDHYIQFMLLDIDKEQANEYLKNIDKNQFKEAVKNFQSEALKNQEKIGDPKEIEQLRSILAAYCDRAGYPEGEMKLFLIECGLISSPRVQQQNIEMMVEEILPMSNSSPSEQIISKSNSTEEVNIKDCINKDLNTKEILNHQSHQLIDIISDTDININSSESTDGIDLTGLPKEFEENIKLSNFQFNTIDGKPQKEVKVIIPHVVSEKNENKKSPNSLDSSVKYSANLNINKDENSQPKSKLQLFNDFFTDEERIQMQAVSLCLQPSLIGNVVKNNYENLFKEEWVLPIEEVDSIEKGKRILKLNHSDISYEITKNYHHEPLNYQLWYEVKINYTQTIREMKSKTGASSELNPPVKINHSLTFQVGPELDEYQQPIITPMDAQLSIDDSDR